METLKHYVRTNVKQVTVSVDDGIDITIEIIDDQIFSVKVENGLQLIDIKTDSTKQMQFLH
ncbi:hypothetical protein [Metabacillus litoralis]|uniref:hypothetical protein n=1 Tax=Metabacillus litoralis TaxID=152268 RepID=UPI00203E96A0|nr:hypothetical protein [Metabacillus litoralis]MCM3652877.1 hypothetical protein [Metabacillus litoralis]